MTATFPSGTSWICKAGRHHWIGVPDDNPEMRGQAYLQCTKCGKRKDPPPMARCRRMCWVLAWREIEQTPAMIGPHPIPPARGLIALTVVVLPGDARDRYREEFRTELCEMVPLAQLGQAVSCSSGAIPLRRALQGPRSDRHSAGQEGLAVPDRPPFLCVASR